VLSLISFGEVKGNKITSFKILRDKEERLKEEIKRFPLPIMCPFFHSTFHLFNRKKQSIPSFHPTNGNEWFIKSTLI
jgi:hypothetical protein